MSANDLLVTDELLNDTKIREFLIDIIKNLEEVAQSFESNTLVLDYNKTLIVAREVRKVLTKIFNSQHLDETESSLYKIAGLLNHDILKLIQYVEGILQFCKDSSITLDSKRGEKVHISVVCLIHALKCIVNYLDNKTATLEDLISTIPELESKVQTEYAIFTIDNLTEFICLRTLLLNAQDSVKIMIEPKIEEDYVVYRIYDNLKIGNKLEWPQTYIDDFERFYEAGKNNQSDMFIGVISGGKNLVAYLLGEMHQNSSNNLYEFGFDTTKDMKYIEVKFPIHIH